MLPGGTPIFILREGTERSQGRTAQKRNIEAAKAIADAIRSTLGPRGMDKMMVDSLGDVVITNDGVTILKEMDVEHPAAKMLVEVAKTQDKECGDGTTTAVILAGELLRRSEEMIDQNVHPTIISLGYKMAEEEAIRVLNKVARDIKISDKRILKEVAKTSMISKTVSSSRDLLADVAVEAVISVAEKTGDQYKVDQDDIQIVKKTGGSVNDTQTINGIIIDKEPVHSNMPRELKDARIALIDSAMEVKKTEVDAKIEITDPGQLQRFLDEEERVLRGMVDSVKKSGANVVFCQKGIDDLVQHFLAKEGIYAVRRAKKSDMEKLAKATGAKVVTRLADISKSDLGKAGHVEVRKIAGDEMTFVTDCKNPKAVSILIRGGTEHVLDEIERSLHDALSVVAVAVEDGKIVYGGGATAVEIALRLRQYSTTVGGREQIAIDSFADALESLPITLAENAGLDSIDTLIELRKAHKDGKKDAGLDVYTGKVTDMSKANVIEPFRVGRQAINSATDAAIMILRIDDVIASKSGGGGGAPGGPGGMGDMED